MVCDSISARYFVKPLRKVTHTGFFQRPGHGDFVEADTKVCGHLLVNAEVRESLPRIGVGLARRRDAKLRLDPCSFAPQHLIQFVGTHVGLDRRQLEIEQARFFTDEVDVVETNRQAIGRQHKIGRDHRHDAPGAQLHGRARLNNVGHALDAAPQRGVARHRETMQAVIENVLHAGRVEHRRGAGDQDLFRLMCGGGRLRTVIVTRQRQHTAPRRGASHVGVLEHITGAIHTRPFAVPDAEHAVVARAGKHVDLLRAPDRRGREVFIHPGLKHDVVFFQVLLRFGERLVVAAQRRAAIAGDEAGGVLAALGIGLPLQHRQAHQRLGAGHERSAVLQRVFIVEGNRFEQLGINRGIHGGFQ